MAKPKVAIYWCASCGGCEEAVVDINETILKVAEAVEFVLAAKDGDHAHIAHEAADLIYHALVLLAERGVPPAAPLEVLRSRHAG